MERKDSPRKGNMGRTAARLVENWLTPKKKKMVRNEPKGATRRDRTR